MGVYIMYIMHWVVRTGVGLQTKYNNQVSSHSGMLPFSVWFLLAFTHPVNV
jgi:hypothetical protein